MRLYGFKGGLHPPERKNTANQAIEMMSLPQKVIIPLAQHTGAPAKPLIAPGDLVKCGQTIGEASGFISAPVHSSISGKVISINNLPHPVGIMTLSVVIESNGKDAAHTGAARMGEPPAHTGEARHRRRPLGREPRLRREASERTFSRGIESLTPKEIISKIREAGIVGLGGAAFPTSVKLSPPREKKIDTIIINGAECEPYLTADHRVMLEEPTKIIEGAKLIMKALQVERGYIAIERNKPDAIQTLSRLTGEEPKLEVIPLKVKYPQGAEKQLIRCLLRREVPSGGLPMDVGVVVQNVGTAVAIRDALYEGKPLYERVLTVTGKGVKEPKNLRVRIGTSFRDILNFCGGLTPDARKVIMGGPLMGLAQYTLDVPVVKGTSGILILTEDEVRELEPRACIRCAKCIEVCPMGLIPTELADLVERKVFDKLIQSDILDCTECGCCAYVCPSNRYLVHLLKRGKAEVMDRRKKNPK